MKKWIFLSLLFAMQSGHAEGLQVRALNNQLQQVNAGWVAKETPLSHISKADAQHMMGLKRPAYNSVQFIMPHGAKAKQAVPSSIDWRNKDGINWVSPILDQGNCGSCVAFASIGTLETQFKISAAVPNVNVKLSPQALFSCGGGACDQGWYPDAAASFLQNTGVPDEACLPYISGSSGQDVSCQAACANSAQRSVHISAYSTPTRGTTDLDSLKAALQKGPVVTTLGVYADFMSYSSGVYKHVTGDMLGGHAISIVGYDDSTRSLIVRNSWGQSWGENGFAHISYDDASGVGDETWLFEMPTTTGVVSINSPLDYTYASGSVPVNTFSSFGATDSLNVAFFDKDGKAVLNQSCKGSSCNQDVSVAGLPDGRYEVGVFAMNAQGASIGNSTRQFFYVVNQKPALSLSFTGSGVDLTTPLKDRIEFDITSTANPVPMNALEFHFRGADGKEVIHATSIVLNDMKIGWRTNLVPNGAYEIWMVGRVKTSSQETVIETPHQTVNIKN